MIGRVINCKRDNRYCFVKERDIGNSYFCHFDKTDDGILENGYLADFRISYAWKADRTYAKEVKVMPSAIISFGGGADVNRTPHYEGTANVRGNWSVRVSGRSLEGEHVQEIVVRDDKSFTVGDNGTIGDVSIAKTPTNLPPYLRHLQKGSRMYDMLIKMDAHNYLLQNSFVQHINSIQKNMDTITRNISNVNISNIANNQTINMTVNCPDITSKEVANQVKADLNLTFQGMSSRIFRIVHTSR